MTEQLNRWRGQFGDSYVDRNTFNEAYLEALKEMFRGIFAQSGGIQPKSIAEIGANIGNNLVALCRLFDDPKPSFVAVEPNEKARARLARRGFKALDGIAQEIPLPDGSAELAFTAGVLIHIHPRDLAAAYKEIHRVSSRYILSLEYFADQPEEKPYWGHNEQLFKRDFGSFWLDQFPTLRTAGYGFIWRRATAIDNMNWWLFEKPGA